MKMFGRTKRSAAARAVEIEEHLETERWLQHVVAEVEGYPEEPSMPSADPASSKVAESTVA
jgi:hypothetical protein